ncbi:MAG: MarR family transcriptional regulator [Eubacteriales bacterium]
MFHIIELISSVDANLLRLLSPLIKAEGLSVSEMIILWKVNKKGSSRIKDLAGEVGLPPSTMTGIFDHLASLGYVERLHDVEDRRSVLIQATPHLSEMISRVSKTAIIELEKIFSSLPEGFLKRFEEDLEMMQNHLTKRK